MFNLKILLFFTLVFFLKLYLFDHEVVDVFFGFLDAVEDFDLEGFVAELLEVVVGDEGFEVEHFGLQVRVDVQLVILLHLFEKPEEQI